MRILHLLTLGDLGGLFRVVEGLAAGQAAMGHDVHVAPVVEPGTEDHPLLAVLRDTGVAVHPLRLRPRQYREERRQVSQLCRSLLPDVLHSHGYRPDVMSSGVGRSLGVAHVTTVHGFTRGGWRNRLYERLQRIAFRHCDAVVAVSAPLAAELIAGGVAPERVHMVRNGWAGFAEPAFGRAAARRILSLSGAGWYLGWVGRVSPEKGLDVAVDALAALSDLPVTLSVIGDGAQRPQVVRQAARLGVASRIRWHGTIPHAGRLLPAFNALLLSSRTEGTPIVLLEAMATGVPIIATRVGGVPDVVTAADALLVRSEDGPAVAAAVRTCMADPAGAERRAESARVRVEEQFSREGWVGAYDDVYAAAVRAVPVAR
jgi:glycosyltransferase involved in cell wall biosynthesis